MPSDDELLRELVESTDLIEPQPRRRRSEVVRMRRQAGWANPDPHPLTRSGPKLRVLRERSGWTTEEIADRTGVPLDVLTDFEEGVPDAAEDVTVEELARLAAACCASLDEVVTPAARQEARRKERKRKQARSGGWGFDPWG
jgi:DNA-binding XRE family transcriptional regulator